MKLSPLAKHFGLVGDGLDEPGEWEEITDADIIEGTSIPGWPNRVRLTPHDPKYGRGIDLQLNVNPGGDGLVRIRLPFMLDPLPDRLRTLYEPRWDSDGNFNGAAGIQEQWFERVGDEMHLVAKVTPK